MRAARLSHAAVACAILLVAGLAGWLSTRYQASFDATSGARHTLSQASVDALAALTVPIEAVAYVPEKHPSREQIRALFAKYRAIRPDLVLRFVDPGEVADLVRAQGINDGDVLVTASGRTERLHAYAEQPLTNVLARLARREAQWLVFVTGHGERSPQRQANFDVSAWANVLRERGLQPQEINLAETQLVPDNTAALVIASPQLPYLPGEVALIEQFVTRGGSLLWFTEPDAPAELAPLARAIGFEQISATIVDPLTQALGIDNPAVTIVSRYAKHPALTGFVTASLLPFAAPVHERAPSGWSAERLFESGPKAWGERGALAGNVAYDDGTDYPGPLPIAVALERTVNAPDGRHTQRVVAVGDGDFVSNTYIGNGGNQDLGTRLVEWVTANDALVAIETRVAPDTTLELARWQQGVIGIGFLLVLPLAFALNGGLIAWRRNRA